MYIYIQFGSMLLHVMSFQIVFLKTDTISLRTLYSVISFLSIKKVLIHPFFFFFFLLNTPSSMIFLFFGFCFLLRWHSVSWNILVSNQCTLLTKEHKCMQHKIHMEFNLTECIWQEVDLSLHCAFLLVLVSAETVLIAQWRLVVAEWWVHTHGQAKLLSRGRAIDFIAWGRE